MNLFRCTIALAALLIVGTASALGAETYSITKATMQNGTVVVTANGEEAETAVAGATVVIAPAPNTGYEVDGEPIVLLTTDWGRANARAMTRGEIPTEGTVAVTAGTTAGTWTFTMPNDDVTVSVDFKKSNYAISVSTVDGGSISAKKGDAAVTTAQYGDSITLGNTPNTGWQFASYSVKDAAGAAVTVANGKFAMPAGAVTVSATFSMIDYTVTIAEGITGGSISANKTTAHYGDTITLSNTPSTGWQFGSYSVKDAAGAAVTVANGKFAMPAGGVTVSATFSKINYAVTIAESITGGAVTVDKTIANYGDSITLGNTPNTGWQFASYSVKDAAGAAVTVANGKFAMPAGAVTVSATFSKIDYTISIPESFDNGSITVSKTTVNYGDTITLTITPAKNYMLRTLVVKDAAGNPIEVTNGKFVMPAGTVTISATFVIAGFEITVGPGEYATFYKEVALYVEDEDAELYTITSVTDTEAVLSDKLEVVAAETPMLVYNKGEETKTFLLIPTEDQADEVTAADEFKGTLEAKDMPASSASTNYYGCTGKAFVWLKSAGKIAANRCWLEISTSEPNSARKIVSGNATGIDSMVNGQWSMDNYYDMQGRKVEKPVRGGIYIKNGKKVIVK